MMLSGILLIRNSMNLIGRNKDNLTDSRKIPVIMLRKAARSDCSQKTRPYACLFFASVYLITRRCKSYL